MEEKQTINKWTKYILHILKNAESDIDDGAPVSHKERQITGALTSFAKEIKDQQ